MVPAHAPEDSPTENQTLSDDYSSLPIPDQRAVPIAKNLFTNGGFLRLAYQIRQLPSGNRMTD